MDKQPLKSGTLRVYPSKIGHATVPVTKILWRNAIVSDNFLKSA